MATKDSMSKPRCGAKTRAGHPCKHGLVPGSKRCKNHGGMSTGPKVAATKHGIYSAGFTDAEMDILKKYYSDNRKNNLHAELDISRIQLRRAWIAAGEAAELEDPEDGLEIVEMSSYTDIKKDSTGTIEHRKNAVIKRRPDMWVILDRCLARVGHIVAQIANIEDQREVNRKLDEHLAQIEKLLPGSGMGQSHGTE